MQTLRYYERRGLLVEPERTLGGHRLYPPETVTVLRVIKAAQRLGFRLEEVADLLEASQHRHGARRTAGLQTRATAKLAEVEAKLADLALIRDTLQSALDAGCDDLIVCADSKCCPLTIDDLGTESASHGRVRSRTSRTRLANSPVGSRSGRKSARLSPSSCGDCASGSNTAAN